MTKIFSSLLFKGVVAHLLLFIFLYFRDMDYYNSNLEQLFIVYLITLLVVIFVLWLPSQAISKISAQVDKLIAGDFSGGERPRGYGELAKLYDKTVILGENISHTQNSLENQRNQLTSLLTYMDDGVIATDRRGQIILANKAALTYLGKTEKELLNQHLLLALHLTEKYSFYDLLEKEPEIVVDFTSALGEKLSLRIKFAIFRRESGFISGIIAVLHDSTEQEKNEREQKLFVSSVSHELRTPLTSVKAYLEALEDGALEDSKLAKSFLKVSLDETNRMMRMISDLLTLSRIDQERFTLSKEIINLSDFLKFQLERLSRVVEATTVTNPSQKFKLTSHFPKEAVWVEIDTDKMTQVIDNIIGNALKYSPNGGTIDLTVSVEENKVHISISDQGMGIAKAELPKLFKRFYRVDKARNSKTGGTGLGLSIVHDIITLHNGTIEADSPGEGRGTTFNITLPYSPDLLYTGEDETWDENNTESEVQQ